MTLRSFNSIQGRITAHGYLLTLAVLIGFKAFESHVASSVLRPLHSVGVRSSLITNRYDYEMDAICLPISTYFKA